MTQKTDQEMFEEALSAGDGDVAGAARSQTLRSDDAPPIKGEKGDERAGKLCQYSTHGSAFMFTTRTVKKLPPGVYVPISTQDGMLGLDRVQVFTDDIVRFPDARSTEIIEEIKHFWSLKKAYKEGNEFAHGGFLHKKGWMIFGPPGSGKTVCTEQLMEEITKFGGITVQGANANPNLLAAVLKSFRTVEPERDVLVTLEDFDTCVKRYDEDRYLAILDGEASINGSVFVATTNYPSRFDPRMYNRPGRFSDVVYIGMPNREQREHYLRSKLKEPAYHQIPKILDLTDGFSIDHMRSVVLGVFFEGKELEVEVARLRKLFKPPKDDPKKAMGIAGPDKG